MKRLIALVLATLAMVDSADACRQCRQRVRTHITAVSRSVVVDRSLVTVPFAVPVGIPVAAAQSFSYRYDYRPPTAYRYGALTQEELADRVAEKVIERFSQIEHLQAIGFRASAVTTHCSACHKGSGAKGGFRLSGRLSPQQSYRALQQIVSGAMPKERHISAEERSELIHELLNLEVEPRRMSIEEVVPAAPTP